MLRISKMTDYAIVVLSLMAREGERTFAAAEVAERTGIASPTVSKLLKSMTRAQIVSSIRGARGGYRLARPPERMSVASIIDALEGPIAITECGVAHDSCQQAQSCHIRGNWNIINRAVRTALESVTLMDMAKPHHTGGEEAVITLASIHHTSR
ncbi:MAG: SUF system Fe-S cluster assembly regulator [Gammaproteobacteria bacterium]|nr:SUF system Fe-S cluster assembly regulator [Gammaproteobacteria bacterium]